MAIDEIQLKRIYQRTSGYCHLCGCKLAFTNYAKAGRKGSWEIEHSLPRSKGGTSHANNLYPACVSCNRAKSNGTTRTARRQNGITRAPLSAKKRKAAKSENQILGAACGGAIGFAVGGPVGAAIGALAGGHIFGSENPDH